MTTSPLARGCTIARYARNIRYAVTFDIRGARCCQHSRIDPREEQR